MYFVTPPPSKFDSGLAKRVYSLGNEPFDFGIVSADGSPTPAGFHFRSGRKFTDETRLSKNFSDQKFNNHICGRWFYGGILFAHFGHFMTESVHRILEFKEFGDSVEGIIFQKAPYKGSISFDPLSFNYIREVFESFFRINLDKVKFLEAPTTVDDLAFRPQSHQLGQAPNEEYLSRLDALESFYADTALNENLETYDKLYLSRRKYLSFGRTLGMGSVEKELEQNGFFILCPEEVPLSSQIHLLRNAKQVVAEAGSAIHLLDLLGPKNLRLDILSRRGRDGSYWKNLYDRRVTHVSVFDSVLPIHHYVGQAPGVGSSLSDPIELMAYLERIGIPLDRERFLKEIRRETLEDLRRLKICLQ